MALLVGVLVVFGAGVAGAAPLGTITEFANPGSNDAQVRAGSDGNLWFTDRTGKIGQITTGGAITELSSGLNVGSMPFSIAAGPDGNLWFADQGTTSAIGMINPSTDAISEFSTGLSPGSKPMGIALGPDGNLWFTDQSSGTPAIGMINPTTRVITEYSSGINAGSVPQQGIVAGPDGNIWFTDKGTKRAIGMLNLTTHAITEFSTGLSAGSAPGAAIAVGTDANLWFVDPGTNGAIGMINPNTDAITEFNIHAGSVPGRIAAGPDGNLWFTDKGTTPAIGTINPATHLISEFGSGLNTGSLPGGIGAGADGNVWFTDQGTTRAIGRIGVGAPAASVTSPAVTGSDGVGVPQACGGDVWSSWAGQQPSHSAFGFDGYQWLLDGSPIAGATGQSYTPTVANAGHLLSCKATVTYTLLSVTVSATSAAVSVFAPILAEPTTLTGVEGAVVSGAVATFTVADTAATAANFSAAITWGDGSSSAGIVTGSGGSFTVTGSHAYADEGTYVVGVALADLRNSNNKAGVSSSGGILDAPLSAGLIKASCSAGPCAVSFGFGDANPGATVADFTATIDWGDTTSSPGVVTASSGGFVVTGSHAYSDGGSGHAIRVTVTDDGGSTVSATAPSALVSLLVGLKTHDDDQENGSRFRVEFSCSSGTGTALLNGVAVTNGQVVRLKLRKSGSQKVKNDDGKLTISATSFLLVVSCSDAARNQGCATATPVFEKHSHDDSQRDAENEQDSGQHGGNGERSHD